MDVQVAQQLTSTPGAHALAAALDQPDPNSLAAATALRREFPADLAAAALDQAAMRQSAVRKIGDVAATMLWTRDGLEQATRGVLVLLAWLVIFAALRLLVWRTGLKKYGAVGA